MKTRLRISLAVIGLVSALVVAQVAIADDSEASAAPLTGETLSAAEIGAGGDSSVTGECNPLGTSNFEFSVAGVATGPYPGTFTEQGTLSLNLAGFEPVSFDSAFTITSMAGTVTGSKSLTGAIVPPVFAACSEAGVADAFFFEGNVAYVAEITTSEGTASDSGEGRVDYSDTQIRGVADVNGFNFVETFVSTSGGGGGDDDDDDDDG
jgi:hypothetical protein